MTVGGTELEFGKMRGISSTIFVSRLYEPLLPLCQRLASGFCMLGHGAHLIAAVKARELPFGG